MPSPEATTTPTLSTLSRVVLAGAMCVATCGFAFLGYQALLGSGDGGLLTLSFGESGGSGSFPSDDANTDEAASVPTTQAAIDESIEEDTKDAPATTIKKPAAEDKDIATGIANTTTTVPADAFLKISSPADGSVQDSKHVTIKGTATPGTRVFAGPYEAEIDDEGNWTINLVLSPGTNNAVLKSKDDNGSVVATATVAVDYDAPAPATTIAPAVAFSANQKYGSCSETEPYDKFYGTGQPGSSVQINSPYGSGSTTVDAKGNWAAKVFFPSSPANQAFAVVVEGINGSKTFEFTHNVPQYPETVAFSAAQQIGVSDASWAYDYFYGTTNPHAAVSISSAYGSVTTQADAWGHFEKKLIFEGLPAGESVVVTVAAENGSGTFTFTWQPAAD